TLQVSPMPALLLSHSFEKIRGVLMKTITKITLPEIKTALPGPKAKEMINRDAKYISPSYTRSYPLVVQRGYGAIIEDVDGNTFLDFKTGVAVAAFRAAPLGDGEGI